VQRFCRPMDSSCRRVGALFITQRARRETAAPHVELGGDSLTVDASGRPVAVMSYIHLRTPSRVFERVAVVALQPSISRGLTVLADRRGGEPNLRRCALTAGGAATLPSRYCARPANLAEILIDQPTDHSSTPARSVHEPEPVNLSVH